MKNNFTLEPTAGNEDFVLLGIACHLKEYRFCWLLNNQLGIGLKRISDLEFQPMGKKEKSRFAVYFCHEPHRDEDYLLLCNHGTPGNLLDRYGETDFLLFVRDLARPGGLAGLARDIKQIQKVLTAFSIPLNGDQQIPAVINDIELLLIGHQKQHRPVAESEHKKTFPAGEGS